tara:strand:+ start:55 stop:312 length:258 start_codon:yes stop_codon:yes gene_type:complete
MLKIKKSKVKLIIFLLKILMNYNYIQMYSFLSGCAISDFILACGCGFFCGCGSRKKYKKQCKREVVNYRIGCFDLIFIDNGNTFV